MRLFGRLGAQLRRCARRPFRRISGAAVGIRSVGCSAWRLRSVTGWQSSVRRELATIARSRASGGPPCSGARRAAVQAATWRRVVRRVVSELLGGVAGVVERVEHVGAVARAGGHPVGGDARRRSSRPVARRPPPAARSRRPSTGAPDRGVPREVRWRSCCGPAHRISPRPGPEPKAAPAGREASLPARRRSHRTVGPRARGSPGEPGRRAMVTAPEVTTGSAIDPVAVELDLCRARASITLRPWARLVAVRAPGRPASRPVISACHLAIQELRSGQAQGRRDRAGRHGGRAPPERHVPGRARERPQGAGPHLREDAHALHPHPAR